MSIKPMHLAGAFVSKESIVFVRSLVPCHGRHPGRPLRSRLQVMGESVRLRRQTPEEVAADMRITSTEV